MMNGFDEAWLREHRAKMAQVASVSPDVIRFTLRRPTKLLNELLRMHWSARKKYAASLANEIASIVTNVTQPIDRAHVEIQRWSIQEPDHDGLVGGCKPLIDCLLPRSDKHPHGLGFVVDDSPAHMQLEARHCYAATRKAQGTTVTIRRLAG